MGMDCRATYFLLFVMAAAGATLFPMLLFHSPVQDGHGRSSLSSSCSSRFQYPFFIPPHRRSSFPISPAFSSAWRRYQQLHRSCTSSKDLTLSFSDDDHYNNDPCHYLVYLESHAGLGNSLLSLASAFTYALLTDRVLLMDRRHKLDSLLCEPFEGSSWLLPSDFPYEAIDNSSTLAAIDLGGNFVPPRFLRLNLQHVRGRRDERFFCEDAQKFLASSSAKWVGWSSNQYYVTELFTMPMFFRQLHAMFPMNGSNYADGVITTLSRLLFLPADGVWEMVRRNYDAYLADAGFRVGVQVRLHGHRRIAGFEEAASQKIQECLTKMAGALPEPVPEQWKTAADKVAVLVASLNGEYARDLGRKYSNVTWVKVETASELARQGNSLEELRMALAEMWLLSFSDILATSSYSTFGYIAQGLGGIRPYILNFGKEAAADHEGIHNIDGGGGSGGAPPCALADSVEPCTHFPVIVQCAGSGDETTAMTADHSAWISAHIRPCPDRFTGWQIVPTTNSSSAAV